MKRIVICSDGTWNRPEKDLKKDIPTNVLRLARAISPKASDGVEQQVFYDWGVGSYYDSAIGGATGRGIEKNITDGYRYIVQNYSPGDKIYLFGFSRGAYTVRSLCGLINNCGILKRENAFLIEKAFSYYKKSGKIYAPDGEGSIKFRDSFSHNSREVEFVGVWDTVGAMGIPLSFLGLFEDNDEFYDTKIGSNVVTARHAMAIDEHRSDFEPTIWDEKVGMDLVQMWFVGAHSDIGGSYPPDKDKGLLSDNALKWMLLEAKKFNLDIEEHLVDSLHENPLATIHNSRRSFYRIKKKYFRRVEHGKGTINVHSSVKTRWQQDKNYRPKNLISYAKSMGWSD